MQQKLIEAIKRLAEGLDFHEEVEHQYPIENKYLKIVNQILETPDEVEEFSKDNTPMGYSNWKAHGEKFGYDKYTPESKFKTWSETHPEVKEDIRKELNNPKPSMDWEEMFEELFYPDTDIFGRDPYGSRRKAMKQFIQSQITKAREEERVSKP